MTDPTTADATTSTTRTADRLISGDGSHTARVDNNGNILVYRNGTLVRKI